MNLTGVQMLTYGLAASALVFVVLAAALKQQRVLYGIAALLSGAAALCAHNDAFWGTTVLAVLAFSAVIVASELVDFNWRLRAALVFSALTLGFVCLWPTLHNISGGKVPLPGRDAARTRQDLRPARG
jgi:hypothetical protein